MSSPLERSNRTPLVFQSTVEDDRYPRITSYFSIDPIVIDKSTGRSEEMEEAKRKILKKMRNDPEDNTIIIVSKDGEKAYKYFITGGVLYKMRFCCRYIKSADFLSEEPQIIPHQSNLVYKQNPVTGEFEQTFQKNPSLVPFNSQSSQEGELEKVKFVFTKKKKANQTKIPRPPDLPDLPLHETPELSGLSPSLNRQSEKPPEVGYDIPLNQVDFLPNDEDPLLDAFLE